MKFFLYALKNVLRNSRRTLNAGLIIIFGVISLLTSIGFIDFSFEGLREQTIRNNLGHIQVFNESDSLDDDKTALQKGIVNHDSLIKKINTVSNIRFSMKRLMFEGLISNGDKTEIFMGKGVQPLLEQKLNSYFVQVIDGVNLGNDLDSEEKEVIIGEGLAKSLKIKSNEYVTILAMTENGTQNAIDLKVVGIVSTGIQDFDRRLLIVDYTSAAFLLETEKVTSIIVVLDETSMTDEVINKLKTSFNGYLFKTWEEMAPFYKSVVNLYMGAFGVLGFIILFIVFITITNTMSITVMERVQEIGVLMALGTSRRIILRNFIYEGIIIGFLFTIIGLLLGVLTIMIINNLGIQVPAPPGQSSGYPLHINILLDAIIWIGLSMPLICLLSSLLPAYKASSKNIIEALNHN
jgi:putative ABC transport system permease protein